MNSSPFSFNASRIIPEGNRPIRPFTTGTPFPDVSRPSARPPSVPPSYLSSVYPPQDAGNPLNYLPSLHPDKREQAIVRTFQLGIPAFFSSIIGGILAFRAAVMPALMKSIRPLTPQEVKRWTAHELDALKTAGYLVDEKTSLQTLKKWSPLSDAHQQNAIKEEDAIKGLAREIRNANPAIDDILKRRGPVQTAHVQFYNLRNPLTFSFQHEDKTLTNIAFQEGMLEKYRTAIQIHPGKFLPRILARTVLGAALFGSAGMGIAWLLQNWNRHENPQRSAPAGPIYPSAQPIPGPKTWLG